MRKKKKLENIRVVGGECSADGGNTAALVACCRNATYWMRLFDRSKI